MEKAETMKTHRVLAIGLDGYEESLERRLIEAGELPALARLREQSARYLLDHGPAQRTGLAWEHFSTGLSPERADRWAAVHFDPATYATWQEGTRLKPFAACLESRTVVFDPPYFDLNQTSQVRGLVGWGAHDPGIPLVARPNALLSEFDARYGKYPAADWLYGRAWPCAERARVMGEALTHAVRLRARAARWMLGERLPDWDLGIVVVSEPHSAIEGLWHGVDSSHPLYHLPSAEPARDGLLAVYRAIDRLVGELAAAFADATVIVFAMGGMGPNRSDVASMVLLPELMYRHAFGRPYLRQPKTWTAISGAGPQLRKEERWADAVNANLPPAPLSHPALRLASRLVPGPVKRALRGGVRLYASIEKSPLRSSIGWMPATRYQHHWRSMRAFALPSFYDGRIRINVAGRECHGVVPVSQYETVRDEIEAVLRECRDPVTGDGVVDYIERAKERDPLTLGPTESDLVVVWKGLSCALDHPKLGRVGPVPFRRPGGHTGRYGLAYINNAGLETGDRGVRSSFDVVPTLIELLGEPVLPGMSGASLLTPSAGNLNAERSRVRMDRCRR
jgi:predicted AlkP superfamily phosphohydrolase/phosphomutase